MLANITPFLLFTIVSSITPGANNFLMLNNSLKHGIKRCIPHYLGICFGFGVMVFLISLLGGALFHQFPWIKTAMQVLSCLLIVYLAWIIFFSSSTNKKFGSKPFTFVQACLFQWINPKAWAMIMAAISLYHLYSSPFKNAFAMGLVYAIVCLVCVGVWLIAGETLKRFVSNEKHMTLINRILAILLVLSLGLEFLI